MLVVVTSPTFADAPALVLVFGGLERPVGAELAGFMADMPA
jgi:hypothetical protein